MISNAAHFKLKASKSSRDLDNNEEETTILDDIVGVESTNHVRIQINSRDGRPKARDASGGKPRQFEYRSARGERNSRGAGNSYRGGRSSYLPSSSSHSSRKFQEPLSKNYQVQDTSNDVSKKLDLNATYGLPEDTRISKLLRRLNQETLDQEKSLSISKKLLEVLLIPDNGRYVRRAFHILSASVLEILHVAPGPLAKKQVASALGRIGYVMEADFRKFQDWLFQKFGCENDEIKVLLMKAIKEALRMEITVVPRLQDFSEGLMQELQASIEVTENPDVFTATLENLITLVEIYPEDFYSQFSNTVDILFGWHVDHTQPMQVIEFVSKSLQRLSKHFRVNLEFSVTLIKHFLEDMDDYIKQLHKDGKMVLEGDLEPIIMSILAVNTVLKCLGDTFGPSNAQDTSLVTYTFATDCLNQIVRVATDALENYVPDNLIIAANDSVTLFLRALGTKTGAASEGVYSLIDLELSLTPELSDATIVSMLVMIAKVVKELGANLPPDLVAKLVGPTSEVLKLRNSNITTIQNSVTYVYQSLLNLKNIPLLQEAYQCVLGDLEEVYRILVPDVECLVQNNPFLNGPVTVETLEEVEITVLFLLRCLSSLANASGSIIGMWALKPSILELLAVNMRPFDEKLAKKAPSLQYALIYLLFSHCKCYNHFVSSSKLVTSCQTTSVIERLGFPSISADSLETKSPSSGNLTIILTVLSNCLTTTTCCAETKLLLLQFFGDVLQHSETYVEMLYVSPEFMRTVKAVTASGYSFDRRIAVSVCENLERLLGNKQLSFSNDFLGSVFDLCKLHMNSNDPEVRKRYVCLSVNVPWDITVTAVSETYPVAEAHRKCGPNLLGGSLTNWSVTMAQYLQVNGSVFGEILAQQFKTFMDYLLNNLEPSNETNWLLNSFNRCWPLDCGAEEFQENCENFRELSLCSRTVLCSWAVWESAQLCVNSKLRTPLGKPIETFTSFETALKNLLKGLAHSTPKPAVKAETSETPAAVEHSSEIKQERVRLLLDFIECLDKCMYNAAEGCAFSMQPPLKPVKTFFHTNTSTCQEWLNRIRTVIIQLALHAGYSTLALRHGHAFLRHLAQQNKTKTPEFERAVMLVTTALLNLKETEALQGLYQWSKNGICFSGGGNATNRESDEKGNKSGDSTLSKNKAETGASMTWIKVAVKQAARKYETAADKYKDILESQFAQDSAQTETRVNAKEESQQLNVDCAVEEITASASTSTTKVDPAVRRFMVDQVINCYKSLNDWKSIVSFMEGVKNETDCAPVYSSVDVKTARVLADLDATPDLTAVMNELMTWNDEDAVTNGSVKNKWSRYQLERDVERNLYNILLAPQSCGDSALENTLNDIQKMIQDDLRAGVTDLVQDLTVLQYAGNGLKCLREGLSAVPVFLVSEEFETTEIEKMDSCLLSKVLWWYERLSKVEDGGGSWTFFANLRLDIIKKARKEGNFRLAYGHLRKYLQQKNMLPVFNRNSSNGIYKEFFNFSDEILDCNEETMCFLLENLADGLIQDTKNHLDVTVWNYDNSRAVIEASKLLYAATSSKRDLALNLCATASTGIMQHLALTPSPDLQRTSCKILLTLAKWIQQSDGGGDPYCFGSGADGRYFATDSSLTQLVTLLPDVGGDASGVLPQDMAVGKLLKLSLNQCPTSGKAWSCFGSWCYKWGRRMVDQRQSSNGAQSLSAEDRYTVQNLLPGDTTQEDVRRILDMLSSAQTASASLEDDIDYCGDLAMSETIESRLLHSVPVLHCLQPEQLSVLVDIWRRSQQRVYTYYELSAEAYFKYLHLTGGIDAANCGGGDDDGAGAAETNASELKQQLQQQMADGAECTTITATLRLLRLMVKHALELQNVLETGLANTPSRPWKVIIPQLFSRLNHPEGYVRKRVSELLCRVAEDSPHLIIFPAVVGAVDGGLGVKFDLPEIAAMRRCQKNSFASPSAGTDLERGGGGDMLLETDADPAPDTPDSECEQYDAAPLGGDGDPNDNDEDESDKVNRRDVLHSCFMSMVETLSAQAPETIAQVQLLVKELRRITLLWDELWLGTLMQHQTEINKRLAQLESEIGKVEANPSLGEDEKRRIVSEKHRIIVKPVVYILERLCEVTVDLEPETPHERQFRERYGEMIGEAVRKLKEPEDASSPHQSWQPLKMLQQRLQQKAHKRSAYSLKMNEISPVLAQMRDTVIAMPGILNKPVRIASVSDHVSILPTKTKPKKLVFHGTDGETYTYLFKGLEDLHLDERIMQFLCICNAMLAKNEKNNLYRARNYSVIPLGAASGLISWVDGTVPVFSLYKRWQQRQLTGKMQVARPSELFWNKLHPLLAEHGVKNKENRKEWPLSCLKQVLLELISETPGDLLEKELWCRSINAASWWQTVRNYSYSVAVMSVVGYVIGLGDRHLDNLLVDLSSGEVVHIDYNVCFEKGKTLRVPEKVPFRMTQNLRNALGVTGVEGIFRMACENVLKTMKKGRETLLTLLEAFVYDPLVDWTVGGEGLAGTTFRGVTGRGVDVKNRQSRKDLEQEVTLAMFNVRCAEMKAEWNNNREEILMEIEPMTEALNNWLDKNNSQKHSEDILQDLHQQMALIKEAEANQRHPLHKLPGRYAVYKKTKDVKIAAQQSLEELKRECEMHLKLHGDALHSIQGPTYSEWVMKVGTPLDKEALKVFELVKEFLQNAGQTAMVVQCEQSENEMHVLMQQLMSCMQNCLAMISQYGQLASLYPLSHMEKHRTVCFLKWIKYILEQRTRDACEEVFVQFNYVYGQELDSKVYQNIVEFNYQLRMMIQSVLQRIKLNCERLALMKSLGAGSGAANGGATNCNPLEKNYIDAKAGISKFLRTEKGALKAFEFVIISELCSLNKQYLVMETTARSAGSYLVTLTSRDGDWFLDEMLLMSSLIAELVASLSLSSTVPGVAAVFDDVSIGLTNAGLGIANSIYRGLQELNYNFHTVILPEAMTRVQCEEPSVLEMIRRLDNIVEEVGVPMDEIVVQLEKLLTLIVLKMDEDVTQQCAALGAVTQMRERYSELLHAQSDNLTPGEMLLMGFNGLFENLNRETTYLIETLSPVVHRVPPSWRKLDQVRDAKALAAPIYDPKARAVLDDIFLAKRLQTMREFFSLCLETANNFRGDASTSAGGNFKMAMVATDEQLSKPIKTFTADYVSRQFLGVKTEAVAYLQCLLLMERLDVNVTFEIEQRDVGAESKVPLEDVCKRALDLCLKRGVFTSNVLAQASGLCGNLVSAWRKYEIPKYVDDKIKMQNSTMTRLQSQLTAHHWLHEAALLPPNATQVYADNVFPLSLKRSNFLAELRNVATGLLSVQPRLLEARDNQRTLIASVEQRLKWAAGANPDLLEVMAAFRDVTAAKHAQLDRDLELANKIAGTCNTLVQYEALRGPHQANAGATAMFEQMFLERLERWREVCAQRCLAATDGGGSGVTDTEENLMRMCAKAEFDPLNDMSWVQKLSGTVGEAIKEQQLKVEEQKIACHVAGETVYDMADNIKRVLHRHVKLMQEVRSLLRAFKTERVIRYLVKHKRFVDRLSLAVTLGKENGLDADGVEDVLEALAAATKNMDAVFEELLMLNATSDDDGDGGNAEAAGEIPVTIASMAAAQPTPPNSAAAAGGGQRRNAYAVSVWRRVRMKLEGRDPDPGRRNTLQEQVDYIINEAVHVDNLALLYEGWTPWV